MKIGYSKDDIVLALKSIIKEHHDVIFISGNLASLGMHSFESKKELLDSFIEIIMDISGDKTTIFTSTFTLHLANTDIPFDINSTKSMHGAIANYFLDRKDSIRSMHPFTSFTAIGENAKYLCTNNSRFSYGIDSPYDRMLSFDNPLTISVGMPPNLTCSIIHHVEFNMHVPYRYIKEFFHPIVKEGKVIYENFYMHVIYHEIYDEVNKKRNRNKKFFEFFMKTYPVLKSSLGNGKLYSYKTKDFYNSAIKLMKKDIYSWLDKEPSIKPYRK